MPSSNSKDFIPKMNSYLVGDMMSPYEPIDENYLFMVTKNVEFILDIANKAVRFDREHNYGAASFYYSQVTDLIDNQINFIPDDPKLNNAKDKLETLYSLYLARYNELLEFKDQKPTKEEKEIVPEINNSVSFVAISIPEYVPPPPPPENPELFIFWKMSIFNRAISDGGFFGPHVYMSNLVWQQDNFHLPEIPMKIELYKMVFNSLKTLNNEVKSIDIKQNISKSVKISKKLEQCLKDVYTSQYYLSCHFAFIPPVESDKRKYIYKNHTVDLAINNMNNPISRSQLNQYKELIVSVTNEFIALESLFKDLIQLKAQETKPLQFCDILYNQLCCLNIFMSKTFLLSSFMDVRSVITRYIHKADQYLRNN
ncbi:hypothetical protein WA158_000613 [Blastocystis sp. Blastoise]